MYHILHKTTVWMAFSVAVLLCFHGWLWAESAKEEYLRWKVHDRDRPMPERVEPGYVGDQEKPGKAPSDAIVLFDGSSTDAFRDSRGRAVDWPIVDGNLVVRPPNSNNIYTKETFGDIQLHLEYMIPAPDPNAKQRKGTVGNSGIFLMGLYEVQVIYNAQEGLYADGLAGGIYGQFPPLVDTDRGLDRWQNLDILFSRPRFDDQGKLLKPAYITVLHNGVLVQNHQEIMGPTVWNQRSKYREHDDALPLMIQSHGHPLRYRNLWIRRLE